MLYLPDNYYPYLNAIDCNEDNNFSMKINGGKCVGYDICIYNNNTNELIYADTNKCFGNVLQKINNTNVYIPYDNNIKVNDNIIFDNTVNTYITNSTYSITAISVISSNKLLVTCGSNIDSSISINTPYKILRSEKIDEDISIYGNSNDESILNITVNSSSLSNGIDYKWITRLYSDRYDIVIAKGSVLDITNSDNSKVPIVINNKVKLGMKIKINDEIRTIVNFLPIEDNDDAIFAVVYPNLTNVAKSNDYYDIISNYIEGYGIFFKGRKIPTVDILNLSNNSIIEQANFTFRGYIEGLDDKLTIDPLQYYVFNLYDNNDVLLKTTNKVFSEDIKFSFNGFMPNNNYKIELVCHTQNDLENNCIKIFSVEYSQNKSSIVPKVKMDYNCNGVNIDWSEQKNISGKTTEENSYYPLNLIGNSTNNANNIVEITTNTSYISTTSYNGLHINKDCVVYYDSEDSQTPLNIPTDFTYIDNVIFDDNFTGQFLIIGDLRYDKAQLVLSYDGISFNAMRYINNNFYRKSIDVYDEIINMITTSTYNEDYSYILKDTENIDWSGTNYWYCNDIISKYFYKIIIKGKINEEDNFPDFDIIIEKSVRKQ